MKFSYKISAGLASLGLLVAAVAQNTNTKSADPVQFNIPNVGTQQPAQKSATTQPAAPGQQAPAQTPAAPAVTFTEAQMMEVYGFMLAARSGLAELGFTPANVDAMGRGMKMAVSGQQPQYDAQAIGQQLQEFLGKKQQEFLTKVRNQNLADAATYFTKLKENKNVKELPSGLRYEVLTEGKGPIAKPGQVVKMHYTGSFINGQVFDSSTQRGEPVEALVQQGALIDGMVEALQKMPVGSKWKLHMPPHLAYGDESVGGIPPAATLVFDVEVLGVQDAPKEDAKKDEAAKK